MESKGSGREFRDRSEAPLGDPDSAETGAEERALGKPAPTAERVKNALTPQNPRATYFVYFGNRREWKRGNNFAWLSEDVGGRGALERRLRGRSHDLVDRDRRGAKDPSERRSVTLEILKEGIVRNRYDVIVVGAGIGGLTAGALLAKRGLRVLVIEQHYIPGGCCTCIRRRDITFDVGAAVFMGCGEIGFTPHHFVMNELEEELDLIRHAAMYRIHAFGSKISFWRDLDRFLEELIAVFPSQERGIRSLYREMKEFYLKVLCKNDMPMSPTETPRKEQVKMLLRDPVGMVRVMRQLSISTYDLLRKHISDPKLIAFYDYLMSFFTCCTVKEVPAIIGTSMFIDAHLGGACYAQGSPQMLPNKLEKSIERNGGQMLYRNMVDEILIERGQAYGVRLADGTEIMADRVVANATVWNLYGRLVRPRHIKPERMAWAQRFEPTLDLFLLYIGVRRDAIPEDAQPVEILIDNIFDFQADNYGIFIPSLEDPSLAPPGMHSMTVMAPSKTGRVKNRFGSVYQSEEYYERKQEEAEKVIDDLERMYFTGLKKNIVCMEAATPATLERFTLKNFGCIGGPKLSRNQFLTKRLRARSEWKNLYLCGDSTTMGEGVVSTTVSGVSAANMVLRDLGLPEYLPRVFPRKYIRYVEGRAWTAPPDRRLPLNEKSAARAAKECQLCEKPRCTDACPAGIDVLNFMRRIEAGNWIGAARSIRERNPLGEVCGYVCPAELLCEKACSRLDFSDTPANIGKLHAWACQAAGGEGWDRFVPERNGYRVAVVGAGPAGLSCAHFLGRLGYQVDVYEKADGPGGMLGRAVPVFRLPQEVVERELKGLLVPGIRMKFNMALGRDVSVKDLLGPYKAVFLAPGLWSGRRLILPGMNGARVADGLGFLVESRTNGAAPLDDRVLVIGGGSVASDVAIMARKRGARKVSVVCLEKVEEMPCLASEVQEMRQMGIEIYNGWGPKEVIPGSKMRFVKCTKLLDDRGRFSPSFEESESMELDFDQIIMAVGQTVESDLARYLKEEFGTEGLLKVEMETLQVKGRPGLYAGGDIIRGAGTVVEAVADGRRAAASIDRMMKGLTRAETETHRAGPFGEPGGLDRQGSEMGSTVTRSP
jgi:phytoene dehydrogenase-like protein